MASFDLKSYFKRIDYEGDTKPSLKTLNALTEAHTKGIAFENINPLIGKPILLSDEAIFDKLVTQRRGGYCFEQNGLLLQVLTHLGFAVKPISGRVRLRYTTREPIAPRTHVFLRVELDGESYVTDCGMGTASLTHALRLIPNIEQETPHDNRRIVQENGRWYHQVLHTDTWQDANESTLEEMPLLDREVANWYTSSHPNSHFRSSLLMARARDNGERIAMQNFEFNQRSRNGESKKTQLQSAQEVLNVIKDEFGLNLTQEDQDSLKQAIPTSTKT